MGELLVSGRVNIPYMDPMGFCVAKSMQGTVHPGK